MSIKKLLGLQLISLVVFPFALNGQTSLEEIISDMVEPHEGRPHGMPANYDWALNPRYGTESPPETWNAAIAWGQLYEWIEGNPATNTRVQIRDLEMYYLSKTDLQWHALQQAVEVSGAAYVEDFAGDVNKLADKRKENDGSISVTCGDGYNFHFWPKQGRTVYPKNDVKGCYVTVRARLIMNDPDGNDDRDSARYVMSVGGDWWESLTAVWDNWTTNKDIGIGRFRFVTPEWKSFNMITLPGDTVRKYVPPFRTEDPASYSPENEISSKKFRIYPNPVSSVSSIEFSLSDPGPVKLTVWGLDGKLLQDLARGQYPAGEHTILWDPSVLPIGIYSLKLEDDLHVEQLKCVVVKGQ